MKDKSFDYNELRAVEEERKAQNTQCVEAAHIHRTMALEYRDRLKRQADREIPQTAE